MSLKTWERMRKQSDPAWYETYLRSHHWRRLRKRKIESVHHQCERCGRKGEERKGHRLHVHHLTYARVGHEHLSDLQVLCHRCHQRTHGIKPKKRKAKRRWKVFSMST